MNHPPIETLLPHTGLMLLLDAVVEAQGERMVCRRTISPGGVFNTAEGDVPAWSGVELMAQCVGAWAGWQAQCEQRPVKLGFLLGTRHYRCDVDVFPAGSDLLVEAVRSFHDDNGMAVFACRIDAPGVHAQARLTVYSPLDAAAFFDSTAQGSRHV